MSFTHVFVSAVSSDLKSARKVVNEASRHQIRCLPVEQSISGTEYGRIRELLQRWIEPCHAVIHIVGRDYGGEPDPGTLPSGTPRRSWTQLEYDFAVERNKRLYVIVCDDTFPFDKHSTPELQEKIALQKRHRDAVLAGEHLWNTAKDPDELRQHIVALKLPLDALRAELGRQQFRHRRQIGLGAAAMVLLLVAAIFGFSKLGRKVDDTGELTKQTQQDVDRLKKLEEEQATQRDADKKLQQQFAERFLENLIRDKNLPVEDARRQALADLPELTGLSADAVRQIIDGRITELAGDAGATPLDRARAKLTIADYDGVLAEEDQQRTESRELAMLAGAAALAKFREQPRPEWNEKALTAFQRALALSNDQTEPLAWADAAVWAAFVLDDLTRFDEGERLLRQAWKLGEAALGPNDPEVATALNNLALLLQDTNRRAEAEPLMRRALAIDEHSYGAENPRVAIDLNNLALLLQDTNRLAEAEPLYRRALAIDEQTFGPEHPNVAIDLNNLAQLLKDTNRLAEAEPLMRRALAIDEQSYGVEHPDVARDLNNLALLLQDTNRLSEAEPLMRRALAIDEHSYGAEHPEVATGLNNLALLLKDTNRLAEVEPLMRRALAIDESSYGAEHPKVAIRLNNLAQLLHDTNRLAEAEPLMRRALAIDEPSSGAGHPNVAIDLNNLALLLKATNRLAEAEPLMRRALLILALSLVKDHPNTITAGENYRFLLAELKHPPDEIERRVMAAMDTTGPLEPIVPEVERLFGPARSVQEVLDELDRQYREQGKPAVWFLPLDEPIAPHLDELLGPVEVE